METLYCVSKKTDHYDLDRLCKDSPDDFICKGVNNNYTTGVYGAYSGCSERQTISWVFNQLFLSKNKDPDICTSAGGIMQTPVPSNFRESDCDIFLRQAGDDGVGRITFTPNPQPRKTESQQKTALTTRIKIEVGVGVITFAILLGSLAFGVYVRWQRWKWRTASKGYVLEKAELPSESATTGTQPQIAELDSSERNELHAITLQEIEGDTRIVADPNTQVHELSSAISIAFELDSTPNRIAVRLL
jgi:hypothetical protein